MDWVLIFLLLLLLILFLIFIFIFLFLSPNIPPRCSDGDGSTLKTPGRRVRPRGARDRSPPPEVSMKRANAGAILSQLWGGIVPARRFSELLLSRTAAVKVDDAKA